jgi:hypothetical protein
MYFTNKQIFYVNSATALTGSNTSFSYYFNIDRQNTYDRVVVLSASIPKSYYLITTNSFTLTENTNSVQITIPQGNYTRQSLANTLQTTLNTSSPNGYTYTIKFNNISTTYDKGYYYFTVTGNGSVQPIFTFNTTFYEQLGFASNTAYNFVASALQSVNIPNLTTETTLFIHSDAVQNSESDNVLQEIYTSGEPSFSYINFININPLEYSKNLKCDGASKTNVYNFWITDEFGNVMNTNGLNLNFTIMFYKFNDIYPLIKGFIKYLTFNDLQI